MNKQFARALYNSLPKLSELKHKGDNGRVGVIGGSFQFTGAPYFSAISALKSGADLAHVFCAKSAAVAIKSYSPEIIVHPVFTLSSEVEHPVSDSTLSAMHEHWLSAIKSWSGAITGWVIGPGLGRDKHMDDFFPKLIKSLNHSRLLVLDADAIFYLCQRPELFGELEDKGRVILTPNHRELGYLKKHLQIELDPEREKREQSEDIFRLEHMRHRYGFNILVKGEYDYYLTRQGCYKVTALGGHKRCGGTGDILAGVAMACAYRDLEYGPLLACWLLKKAAKQAFKRERRGTTAPTVLSELCAAFIEVQAELARLAAAYTP